MRLLFVFSTYPAETFAIVEVEALRSQGFDVVPLSLRGGRRWLRQPHATRDRDHDRVKVVPLTAPATWFALIRFLLRHPLVAAREFVCVVRENASHPGHLARSLFVWLKAPAVADLVRNGGIDAVHIFWGHYPSLIIPFVKRAAPSVPVTAFLGAYSLRKRIPSGPRVLADADAITTHFDDHVADIRSGWLRRPLPVALIYRGLDLTPLTTVRRESPDRARIVIVSRLVPEKTVEDGLRAFALLHRGRPELRLDIVGDGACRDALQRRAAALGIESNVTFHGQLAHDRTLSIIAGATAMILPSPSEFFPNAIKEAMALGVPCAAYDIPGVAAYDATGRALRLAPVGNVEALARVTAELIDDPALAGATAAAAAARIRDFDIRTTSLRQAELFRALITRTALPAWVIAPAEDRAT